MRPHDILTDELRDEAVAFVLDLMDPQKAQVFERHLQEGCAVCAAEVRAFAETCAQLGVASSTPAPAGLRRRLMSETQPLPPGMHAVRSNEGQWMDSPFPGVTVKPLYRHPQTKQLTQLVRLAPGALYPQHHHAADEQCLVLEGDVMVGNAVYYPGDFSWAVADTNHGAITSEHGCLLLLVTSPGDKVLTNN